MIGTFLIKTEYSYDGKAMSNEAFDALARSSAGVATFEDFRAGVSARVIAWEYYDEKHGSVTFDSFASFARFLSVEKIQYAFTYDGVEVFAFLDAETRRAGYEYVEKETLKDEKTGRFKKYTGNGFYELSGELGQRYLFTIWTKARRTRAEGGDRHERTHGTDLYALKNFFNRGYAKTARAFGVEETPNAKGLFEILKAFDAACVELTGRAFLGRLKPRSMTAGGLAKKELLRAVVGTNDDALNVKLYKKAHPITNAQDEYLRQRKLNRGGINYANPRFVEKQLVGVKKYDVSSEYSAAASNAPDLLGVECVDVAELFKPRAGYVYIAIFDEFHAVARCGMPAIFTHPDKGTNPRKLDIYTEQAFFWEEIEALKPFYDFGECSIKYALRVKTGKNTGNKRFAEKYYAVKENARKNGNYALAEFAKLMLNSAWGKYSQRSEFPLVRHVYDEREGLFHVKKIEAPTPPPPEARAGGLSILQGAYIIMRGRVLIMDYILRTCGTSRALNTFIYTDTDSILTFAEAPAEIVAPSVMGLLKDESDGGYIDFKLLDKKVYYCVRTATPLDADVHARGVPLSAIVDELTLNYGVDAFDELPPEALANAFADGYVYTVPALVPVSGGRAVLYIRRSIRDKAKRFKTWDGRQLVGDENGRLVEI